MAAYKKKSIFPQLDLGISLVIAGLLAATLGMSKIVAVYQRIYSPLDQAYGTEVQGISPPHQTGQTGGASDGSLEVEEGDDRYVDELTLNQTFSKEIQSVAKTTSLRQNIPPQLVPARMVIDAIDVNAEIVPVQEREVEYLGDVYRQWDAPPSEQLGWHNASARLGSPGNTVINGHSSGYGDTFKHLSDLQYGDVVEIYAEDYRFRYFVTNVMILKERWEPIETRMENAVWINESDDERLTLVSCWPTDSSTHRIIVVAVPLQYEWLDLASNPDPDPQQIRWSPEGMELMTEISH